MSNECVKSFFSDPRREAFNVLVDTARLVRNHIDQRAREHGTTRAQWALLGRLYRREGQTQAELAELLEIQPISLTRLVDRLAEQGLVERRPHPTDRRANLLFLTPAGRRSVESFAPLALQVTGEMFEGVDDHGVAAFVAVLETVKRNIKAAADARQHADRPEVADAG